MGKRECRGRQALCRGLGCPQKNLFLVFCPPAASKTRSCNSSGASDRNVAKSGIQWESGSAEGGKPSAGAWGAPRKTFFSCFARLRRAKHDLATALGHLTGMLQSRESNGKAGVQRAASPLPGPGVPPEKPFSRVLPACGEQNTILQQLWGI